MSNARTTYYVSHTPGRDTAAPVPDADAAARLSAAGLYVYAVTEGQ